MRPVAKKERQKAKRERALQEKLCSFME